MLGECVRARVVKTIGCTEGANFTYPLNYGYIYDTPQKEYAYIMGLDHAVSNFDGRVIAVIEPNEKREDNHRIWILAPKSSRFINLDIIQALELEALYPDYKLTCYYESSAGAVIYKKINNTINFLLIKNKRSAHWGFPKGHLEMGETRADAARREVLEETGVHVNIHIGFEAVSKYKIKDKIDKKVSIFVGTTDDKGIRIQREEIERYIWLPYFRALNYLKFDNDKIILKKANRYLINHGYLPEDHHFNDSKKNKNYKEKQKRLEEKRKERAKYNKDNHNHNKNNKNKQYNPNYKNKKSKSGNNQNNIKQQNQKNTNEQ